MDDRTTETEGNETPIPQEGTPKSIEQQLDAALNKLDNATADQDYAHMGPITLTARVPANVVFITILLGTEIQSPNKERMTVVLELDNAGLRLSFAPYLFIDGLLNGKLYGISLDFDTGKIQVEAKGLLGQVQNTIERELKKLLQGTLLDQEIQSQLFPYRPFEDPDLKGTLATLQQQLKEKFKPKAGEDTKPTSNKEATPLPPLESVELSVSILFKEKLVYDFGVGQAVIPVGDHLRALVQLKGNLNQLDTLKIPHLSVVSQGLLVTLQDKIELVLQKMTYQYGGLLQLDEVAIKGTPENERLADALQVVLEELFLPIVNDKIRVGLTQLIEGKVDELLVGRGIDAKKAFGFKEA